MQFKGMIHSDRIYLVQKSENGVYPCFLSRDMCYEPMDLGVFYVHFFPEHHCFLVFVLVFLNEDN